MADQNEIKALADRLCYAEAECNHMDAQTDWDSVAREALRWRDETRPQQPATLADASSAWAEGYRAGVLDERTSEANIGIAGFGAKIEPARENPYAKAQQPAAAVSEGYALVPVEPLIRARNTAMQWVLRGRIPECGKFGDIAQDLDWLLAAARKGE